MRVAVGILILFLLIAVGVLAISFILGGGSSADPSSGSAGILFSEDRGETWTRASGASSDQINIGRFDILAFASPPAKPDTFLVGTPEAGLYRSENRAESWELLRDEGGVLSPKATVYDIAFSPEDASVFYVAVFQNGRGQVLRAEENGNVFRQTFITSAARKANRVFAVAVHPETANRIFVGTEEGLFLRSEDEGASWKNVHRFSGTVRDILIIPEGRQSIFVSTSRGLFRSQDGGETFEGLNDRIREFSGAKDVRTMVFEPQRPTTLYLGTAFGLIKSIDGGDSFFATPLIIPPKVLPVRAVAVDPRDFRNIYVGAGDIVYKSRDVGETWSPVRVTGRLVTTLFVHWEDPAILFAGIQKK